MRNTFLFIMLGVLFLGNAQTADTTNEGVLYVAPNTLMTVIGDFTNTDMGEYENNGEVLLRGDFTNEGITTFDATHQGYTRFQGFSNQEISGSVPADFYDVLFDNANTQPAFHLYGNISVAGNADFIRGIVQNDNYGGLIVFEEGATHTNVDDNSHVDGYVEKAGAEEFIYPIGDSGYYRFAGISPTGNSNQVFTGKYFYENSDLLYPHENRTGVIDVINNQEYWTITKETNESEDILVTLSWDELTTTPSPIVAEPYEAIHIVRWDEAQQLWVSEGGAVDEFNRTVTTSVQVEGYGVFTLARVKTDLILPDDVVIYNAVSPNNDGMNDYFIIDNIQRYPNNRVQVFNRWGVKLFDTTNYDSNDNVFKGYSDARATLSDSSLLPTGTYFYIVEYLYDGDNNNSRWIKKAGYLHLTAD